MLTAILGQLVQLDGQVLQVLIQQLLVQQDQLDQLVLIQQLLVQPVKMDSHSEFLDL